MAKGLTAAVHLTAIANAIREINGLDTRYKPRELADAIRGLGEEIGEGPKAVLYEDGTLEFTCKAIPLYLSAKGIQDYCVLDVQTYGPDNLPPWHSFGFDVTRVVFDSSFEQANVVSFDYWCHGMEDLAEVYGLEHLTHIETANHAFDGCTNLQTIYAAGGYAFPEVPDEGIFDGVKFLVGGELRVDGG